jgi:urease accessory protein UreF
MSEFQYVGFRAIDAPLTDDQLEYMQRQSSRAEITRWSFDNTYHYGDFHGNAAEMLRRGYDIHLHYANFGIRKLMIRLPQGLPATKARCAKYIDGENIVWQADAKGPAGILTISVSADAGILAELWDADSYLDRVVGVRQQLIGGDPRPLYVAWMCGCQSDDIDPESAGEPPVPAGLAESSVAIDAMLAYYDLSSLMVTAAAERSLPLSQRADQDVAIADWLESVDAATLREWTLRFLTDEPTATKTICLQAFRKARKLPPWPTKKGSRTFTQLVERANELAEQEQAREEERQQQARRGRLADMAKSPKKYLDEVNKHVSMRGRDHYEQAAQVLSDIREAVGGEKGDKIARQHAARRKKKYPTLKILSGALRRKGLLS